ncbi:MAG: hypothetical protein Q9227_001965 [Pyrenula ochraceoflavens]
MWYFCEIFYGASSTMIKLAAGTLLLRVTTIRVQVWIIWGILALATIFGISFLFILTFQCSPIHYFWTSSQDPNGGKCLAPKILTGIIYAHAAVNSICDWTYGILPFLIVKDLSMTRRTKLLACVVLVLGNISSVATLVRFKAIGEIAASTDFLFATVDLAIWSTLEVGIAVAAVSLVTIRPLLRLLLGRYSTTYGDSHQRRPSRSDFHAMKTSRQSSNYGMSNMKPKLQVDSRTQSPSFNNPVNMDKADLPNQIVTYEKSLSDDGDWQLQKDKQRV